MKHTVDISNVCVDQIHMLILYHVLIHLLDLLKSKHTSGQAIHSLRKEDKPKDDVLNGNECYRFITLLKSAFPLASWSATASADQDEY